MLKLTSMFVKTPLAWLQITKEKNRLIAALAGIAFADLLIFMQLGFQLTIYYSQSQLHRNLNADIVLISAKTVSLQAMHSFSQHRIYQANSLEEVESVNSLYVSTITSWKEPEKGRNRIMLIVGYDPDKPALELPEINQYQEALKTPDVFLFDIFSRGDFIPEIAKQLNQGKTIVTEANGRKIEIIGSFTLGAMAVADGNLITSDLSFTRLFPQRNLEEIEIGLIKLKPDVDANKVKKKLVKILPNDVIVLTKNEYAEFEKDYVLNSSDIGTIFNIGVVMAVIIGSVIMYQVLYAEIMDHLSEYAALKARGYRDSYLLSIVCQQALILSIIAYVPGFIGGVIFYKITSSIVKLAMFMTFNAAIKVFILSILMCLTAALISARQLQNIDPAELFL